MNTSVRYFNVGRGSDDRSFFSACGNPTVLHTVVRVLYFTGRLQYPHSDASNLEELSNKHCTGTNGVHRCGCMNRSLSVSLVDRETLQSPPGERRLPKLQLDASSYGRGGFFGVRGFLLLHHLPLCFLPATNACRECRRRIFPYEYQHRVAYGLCVGLCRYTKVGQIFRTSIKVFPAVLLILLLPKYKSVHAYADSTVVLVWRGDTIQPSRLVFEFTIQQQGAKASLYQHCAAPCTASTKHHYCCCRVSS